MQMRRGEIDHPVGNNGGDAKKKKVKKQVLLVLCNGIPESLDLSTKTTLDPGCTEILGQDVAVGCPNTTTKTNRK